VSDYVGGIADLEARRVRFIGDPAKRIAEDYLRILRFFRFHAAYGSGPPDTPGLAACIAARAGLNQLSRERVRMELLKLLLARRAAPALATMAESGLLDGHEATTTWWLAPLFRKRYPGVVVDESNMIVKSGQFVTAGAALSHMDLALWIIRSVSPQLAALTAKYLIVDSRPSQSAYALTDHLIHSDAIVQRFERWARERLADGFSLDDAAKASGASKRTLARRMQDVLGKTPLSYFQSLRVERAVHLLKTGNDSVDEIAARVGYADGVTLRTLLRRHLGYGIREIRRTG